MEPKTMRQAAGSQSLVGFLATSAMIIAGPILMRSPPPRPLTDQRRAGGGRPDEAGQQMTHFRGGQSNEPLSRQRQRGFRWHRQRTALLHANLPQEGISEH